MEVCSHFERFRAVLLKVMTFWKVFSHKTIWFTHLFWVYLRLKSRENRLPHEISTTKGGRNFHFRRKSIFLVRGVRKSIWRYYRRIRVKCSTFWSKNTHFRPKIENLKSEIGRNFGHWGPAPLPKIFWVRIRKISGQKNILGFQLNFKVFWQI